MSEEIQEPIAEEAAVIGGPEDMAVGEPQPEAIPEEIVAAPASENIKIGNKTFETQQDAWDYADKLAEERLAQDAYRQGLEDAQQMQAQVTQEPISEAPDTFDEDFYGDPKKFLKDYGAKIEKTVTDKINTAATNKERTVQLWKEFYSANPDLQVKDKLVQTIMTENWDAIKDLRNYKDGLKLLAQKTREELKRYSDSDKPSVEMPRTAVQVSTGSGTGVTQPQAPEKKLDFLSQINQHQSGKLN